MADEKHLYLTIQGTYKNAPLNQEVWQIGLRLALVFGTIDQIGTLPSNWNPISDPHTDVTADYSGSTNWIAEGSPADNFDPLDFLTQQVLPAVVTWGQQAPLSSQAYVETLRLYPIGPDGRAVPAPPYAVGTPAIVSILSNTYADGGGSGGLLPLQNSIVVSTRTQQVGRRGRGRFFQPAVDMGVISPSTSALIASASRTIVANKAAGLLQDLTWNAGVGTAHVAPIVTGAPWTSYARITEVRVGSVPDTQRRRRGALPEDVTTAPV